MRVYKEKKKKLIFNYYATGCISLVAIKLHRSRGWSQTILFKGHTNPVSSPGKSKAAALFAETLVVFTGFKYHLRYGTSGFPAITAELLSTKVVQYGLVNRHPASATAWT